jgi:hypothetical protein
MLVNRKTSSKNIPKTGGKCLMLGLSKGSTLLSLSLSSPIIALLLDIDTRQADSALLVVNLAEK